VVVPVVVSASGAAGLLVADYVPVATGSSGLVGSCTQRSPILETARR
jgi:hypothetical protein